MDPDRILDGLNAEQRRAVEAVRGPVVILAGAGTGKTTTITRRIAYQVATAAFGARELLAVTFTDRAAGELRARLERLGVRGVRARTFHATALAQLRHLAPDTGRILPAKAQLLAPIARSLHRAYRYRPLAELAGEIEWAKNLRLPPERYLGGLGDHEPPVPPDVMARVYAGYEERKRRAGWIDFEDVLELLVRAYERAPAALARFREQCRAITVDEYQDVNLLQQSLLDLWLGDRDELCVVGDDYQAIYSFTGATPAYLLGARLRFPHATVVRLERTYRSTAQILGLANRLASRLGGEPRTLVATRPDGPEPALEALPSAAAEVARVVEVVSELRREGTCDEEIAILVRVNARSEELEEPLAAAGIPYRVRGGAFLDRPAARAAVKLLRRTPAAPAPEAVVAVTAELGLLDELPEGLGDEGVTYQEDLRRLLALAAAAGPARTTAELVADLEARFASDGQGRGVQILTYHRVKGLEFDAVLLPFLQEGELPWRRSRSEAAVAEERRLLYVGLTRARRSLHLSWSAERAPSRFLAELGVPTGPRPRSAAAPGDDGPVLAALREWRRRRAAADGVPAYVVFHDRTLAEIAARLPAGAGELAQVPGVGPAKLGRYGADVLAVVARGG
ncbi:MAG: ATP-dependent DNA helicase UvrD2 [Thermoleophilia bacterium]|nr:ATP-dependent DNA helicase UvrD2 [Thermoleophilia bacterium]